MIVEEIIRETGLRLRRIYSDANKYVICDQTGRKSDSVITNNFRNTYTETDEEIPAPDGD